VIQIYLWGSQSIAYVNMYSGIFVLWLSHVLFIYYLIARPLEYDQCFLSSKLEFGINICTSH